MSVIKKYQNSNLIFLSFFIVPISLVKLFSLDILDSEVFDEYWQILDLPLLFEEPIKSLIYQHSQPPFFNFLIFILNQFGGDLYNNFVIFNSICIGAVSIIIFKIIYKETNNYIFSYLISFIFSIFPSTILYITYSFYPCITVLLYGVLTYSFYIVKKQKKYSLFLFGFSVFLLSLTRSSFSYLHLFFFMIIYIIYLGDLKNKIKIYLFLFLILILSLSIPLKNYFLYGINLFD